MSTAHTVSPEVASRTAGEPAVGAGESGVAFVTDTLATGVVFALVLTLVQRGLGFVRGLLFCRLMTPEELGQFSLLSGGLLMLAPLAVLGLPGTFGRFVEHYSQSRQLQGYLRLIGRASLATTVAMAIALVAFPKFFSWLLLGTPEQGRLVWLGAAGLLAVAWCNYLTSLVEAMRQVRLASLIRFVMSVTFLAGGVGLLWGMSARAEAAILAFSLSSLCGALPAWWYLRSRRQAIAESSRPLAAAELWPRILPYAAWWWFSNLLHNAYDLADRYLLLWFSSASTLELQGAAGQLHAAKVLPILVANVAAMLSGMLLPFVTAALVRGEPERASQQLNWTLKLAALALSGISFGILCVAPWLFQFLLEGRYSEGLELLPWATAACAWLSLLMISQDWLWARERGRLAVLAMLGGLVGTLLVGWLSVSTQGAKGAMVATLAGNVLALLLVCGFNQKTGCRLDRGVWLGISLPLLTLGGPEVAAAGLILMAFLVVKTELLFSVKEKQQIEETLQQRWKSLVRPR